MDSNKSTAIVILAVVLVASIFLAIGLIYVFEQPSVEDQGPDTDSKTATVEFYLENPPHGETGDETS